MSPTLINPRVRTDLVLASDVQNGKALFLISSGNHFSECGELNGQQDVKQAIDHVNFFQRAVKRTPESCCQRDTGVSVDGVHLSPTVAVILVARSMQPCSQV